jgi:trehalose-phosphatase
MAYGKSDHPGSRGPPVAMVVVAMANQGITNPIHDHRPSVLIVDDDAEMRALLRDVLGREGFDVYEHTSGDGLVPLLEDWAPDAIVLDKEMTGPTGLDLLPYIKRRHPATPVILVTAFGGADVEAEALRLGAAYYMDKPFRVARLLEVLRAATPPPRGSGHRCAEFGPSLEAGHYRRKRARSVGPGNEPADPRELAREIVGEARSRGGLLLFADYEIALCPRAPDHVAVALPLLARGALVALAATPSTRVVIISGGDASDLEAQVNVPGVIYAGCRGLQVRGAGMTLSHPVAARMRAMVPIVARKLSQSLAPLSGVEVETKDLNVTIHVRRADPSAIPAIVAQAEELRRTPDGDFQVSQSADTVDLFPDVDWQKGACAIWILEQWVREFQGPPTVVYLGDAVADEEAYLALRGRGYAVHVGQLTGESVASCWVVDQAAAIDLLAQIVLAWRVHSSSR